MYIKLGVTGNRPFKLPELMIPELKERLNEIVVNFKSKGGKELYHGGALGVDTWTASAAFNNNVKVHTLVPFEEQADDWDDTDKMIYKFMLKKSESVKVFGDRKDNKFYFERNQAIIDNCDILLAVHNVKQSKSGALWTMNRALELGKPVIEIKVHSDKLENIFHPKKKA